MLSCIATIVAFLTSLQISISDRRINDVFWPTRTLARDAWPLHNEPRYCLPPRSVRSDLFFKLAPCASLNHSMATRSHTSLSIEFIDFSENRLASSARFRYCRTSSEVTARSQSIASFARRPRRRPSCRMRYSIGLVFQRILKSFLGNPSGIDFHPKCAHAGSRNSGKDTDRLPIFFGGLR
jgi:hypothetical protein